MYTIHKAKVLDTEFDTWIEAMMSDGYELGEIIDRKKANMDEWSVLTLYGTDGHSLIRVYKCTSYIAALKMVQLLQIHLNKKDKKIAI